MQEAGKESNCLSSATIESQTNSTDNTRNLNSDTPEGIINITSIDNANYATDYQLGDANNHQEGNSTNTKNLTDSEEIDTQHQRTLNLTDKHTEQTTGFYNVSQSKLLEDYRKTFLNIDLMIIEELRDLFLVIW